MGYWGWGPRRPAGDGSAAGLGWLGPHLDLRKFIKNVKEYVKREDRGKEMKIVTYILIDNHYEFFDNVLLSIQKDKKKQLMKLNLFEVEVC